MATGSASRPEAATAPASTATTPATAGGASAPPPPAPRCPRAPPGLAVSARRNLHALGARLGIVPTYWDIMGREHPTSDATCEALARAMGRDASDEAAAARALGEIEAEEAARLVEPVQVWREYAQGAPVLRVRR